MIWCQESWIVPNIGLLTEINLNFKEDKFGEFFFFYLNMLSTTDSGPVGHKTAATSLFSILW